MATSSLGLLLSWPSSSLPSPPLSPHPRISLSSPHVCISSSSSSFLSIPWTSPLKRISSRIPSSPSVFSVDASAEKKKVLIINTNSGGHAVIGFYFAKQLLGSGHQVTVMTVGDESSDKMNKPPFNRFSEIVSNGGATVWGNPLQVAKAVEGMAFDVVLDNNGKDLDTVRPVVDWAKSAGVKQFLYISSAGIYTPSDEQPHVEGDSVKSSASHVAVEKYIAQVFSSWAVFRPQYMIGSGNNKDCEEWFFDRIVRDRLCQFLAPECSSPTSLMLETYLPCSLPQLKTPLLRVAKFSTA